MRYLSEAWLRAADDAVRAQASSAPAAALTIDQHVEGATSYRVSIARNACSITAIDAADSDAAASDTADATFRQSLSTATAVATGTTDAHQAFLLGRITFVGNVDVLIERRDAFTWLETTLAPILAETTFD